MQAHGYIQIREALDRASEVFVENAAQLSANDIQLKREIELLRMKVVRSETGSPFTAPAPAPAAPTAPTAKPFAPAAAAPAPAAPPVLPPDLTKAPWSR